MRDEPNLPADFGKIDGEDHPDTVVARHATAAERERCVKIAKDWLATFGERGPTSGAVSAQAWANDAVRDIIDAIQRGDQ